jgi:hypothetical protein
MTAAWYEVIEPFEAFMLIGTTASNTYVGSSMACGNVYLRARVPVGSRVADLPGGLFVEVRDVAYSAKLELSDKHPFEKTYGPVRRPPLPAGLRPIEKFELNRWRERRYDYATLVANHRTYGRSIDFVLEEEPQS